VDALNVVKPHIFNDAAIIRAHSSDLPERSTPSTKSSLIEKGGSPELRIENKKEISKQIKTFLALHETQMNFINKDNGDIMVNIVRSGSETIIREIATGLTDPLSRMMDIHI
jgi:uncharacterized FlaG/YvyC family protein